MRSRCLIALVSCVALIALAFAVSGCSALAQAMGANPNASAPAVLQHTNVYANDRGGKMDRVFSKDDADQSGPVGATGNASQHAELTQETNIDPEAVGHAITDGVKTFTAPAAVGLLDAAQSELAGGDAEAAKRLLDRATKTEKAEKAKAAAEAAAKADAEKAEIAEKARAAALEAEVQRRVADELAKRPQ